MRITSQRLNQIIENVPGSLSRLCREAGVDYTIVNRVKNGKVDSLTETTSQKLLFYIQNLDTKKSSSLSSSVNEEKMGKEELDHILKTYDLNISKMVNEVGMGRSSIYSVKNGNGRFSEENTAKIRKYIEDNFGSGTGTNTSSFAVSSVNRTVVKSKKEKTYAIEINAEKLAREIMTAIIGKEALLEGRIDIYDHNVAFREEYFEDIFSKVDTNVNAQGVEELVKNIVGFERYEEGRKIYDYNIPLNYRLLVNIYKNM